MLGVFIKIWPFPATVLTARSSGHDALNHIIPMVFYLLVHHFCTYFLLLAVFAMIGPYFADADMKRRDTDSARDCKKNAIDRQVELAKQKPVEAP